MPDVHTPEFVTNGSAGLDLYCHDYEFNEERTLQTCHTGIAVEIPKGYVGLLFPRSSVSKKELMLKNCVGVIDSDYRGEIIAKFQVIPNRNRIYTELQIGNFFHRLFGKVFKMDAEIHGILNDYYQVDEKCVQLILVKIPNIELIETNELTTTERSDKGFGQADEGKSVSN